MFDLLFPTYCINCGMGGEYLCTKCKKKLERTIPECYICRRISNNYVTHTDCNRHGIDSVFIGWKYNSVAKKILSQFKYRYSYKLSTLISELLIKRLHETEFLKDLDSNSILIPMPIHNRHLSDRGFNQSLLIARNISKEFNIKIIDDVLFRKGSSKYQAKLSIKEREDLGNVFYLRKKLLDKNVIILDDVVTTGSTLNSAARILKGNEIKAIGLFRGKPHYHQ